MKKYVNALLLSLISTQGCFAGVTITGTRIIFPSDQNQVVIQLNNPDQHASLVQSWLDDGNPKEIPPADRIPFILTPPLVRIEAQKGQMLRLIAKDTSQLPKDRESLYWFNILDVAPTSQNEPNKLNISVRSRIKVFYRPSHLTERPESYYIKLKFKYSAADHTVVVSNPSPYFINFQDVTVNSGSGSKEPYTAPLMIAPLSETRFSVKTAMPKTINYTLINDFGGTASFNAKID